MAGDWIKMRVDLQDDPAVISLSAALDLDEFSIIGRLHKLWSWADRHLSQSGHAKGVTGKWIDRYVSCDGFSSLMEKAGWLLFDATGVTFPNFDRHNGESAKSRAEAAERKRLSRKKAEEAALMSQEICDKAVTREEERREELKPITNSKELVVFSGAEDLPAEPEKLDKPDCPHQDIIALYHEVLPQCPRIRDWTPARAIQLRARWNEDKLRQTPAYWRELFEYVASCDFLVGRSGKTPFFADLAWMTKSENFTKIREGKYENRGNA